MKPNKKLQKEKALTSNERKELRRHQEEKNIPDIASNYEADAPPVIAVDDGNDDSIGDIVISGDQAAFIAKKGSSKRTLWIIITASILAALLIAFAIIFPVVILPRRRFSHIPNPVVVFTLNTGERIELTIFENELPNGATNFIHLARIGFFNNTIIFDNTNAFVRFGQVEDATFRNFRTTNETFLGRLNTNQLPRLSDANLNHPTQNWSPFDYRVTAQHNRPFNNPNRAHERGFLSLMHTMSGVDFQISTAANAHSTIQSISTGPSPSTKPLTGYVIGEVTTVQSLAVLDRIAALERRPSPHHFFRPPREDNGELIYIRRTHIYNLDFWGKWRNFNWNNYFQPYGETARVGWVYGAGWQTMRFPASISPDVT